MNPKLLDDILTIVSKGGTYVDESGQEFSAVPLSDIAPTLTGSHHGLLISGISRWKNVSNIDASDLQKAGFRLIRSKENPNRADIKGNFRLKYSGGGRLGRSLGKWTTLVTV